MDITQKIDSVTQIGESRIAMEGIQPPPKSVKIEITARCNLRCKYCAVRTRTSQPKEDMDFEFFKDITQDMRMSGVEEIGVFYLGESFMAPQLLVKCIRWCKDIGFPWVFLTTNGTMARPKVLEAVMEAGLDSLKWSINHDSYEQFHDITGGSEKQYNQIIDNIQAAWEIRDKNGYNTIISASSILYDDQFKDTIRAFLIHHINAFVDRHYWLPMYQMGMYKEEIEKALGYVPTIGNMGRLDDDMKPNRRPLPCWAVFTEGHVRVDGGLSACCFGSDDRFDMGMLNGANFIEQWNSKKFQLLRKAHINTIKFGPAALKDTPCRVCVAYDQEAPEPLMDEKDYASSLLA